MLQVVALLTVAILAPMVAVGGTLRELHVSTLGVPFGGLLGHLFLKHVVVQAARRPWDWFDILDWKSPYVALLTYLVAVSYPAVSSSRAAAFYFVSVLLLAVTLGMYIAMREGLVHNDRYSRARYEAVGLFLVFSVGYFAGITENFVDVAGGVSDLGVSLGRIVDAVGNLIDRIGVGRAMRVRNEWTGWEDLTYGKCPC